MKKVTEVRGVRIGEGIPKIIVPIVGQSKEEILRAAESLKSAERIKKIRLDIVEWRADWFEDVFDFEKVRVLLEGLRDALGDTPILFTFRTSAEGGEKAVEPGQYADLIIRTAGTGLVDLVDVETFISDEGSIRRIIDSVHAAGARVVASSHHFDRTPDQQEIVDRLCKMQELGADLLKIAVMPQDTRDVIVLLSATREMAENHADRPIITMSMGGTGLISRLCGEIFGSSCTFGSVGKASAPGQMDAEDLDTILRLIHEYS